MTRVAWIGLALCGGAAASGAALYHAARSIPMHIRPPVPGVTFLRTDTEEGPRLIVSSMRSNGVAAKAGLHVGDRLEAADGQPAESIEALRKALEQNPAGPIALRVRRGTTLLDVDFNRPNRGGHSG